MNFLTLLLAVAGFFLALNVAAQQPEKSVPTIWDSMPSNGQYEWFKRNSSTENLKVFQTYESKKGSKFIAACIPNAYGFYVLVQWNESIKNEIDAERLTRKLCETDATVLLAFVPDEKEDTTWRDELYVDKFTNQKIKMSILTFTERWHNGYKSDCKDSCSAWVWPDSVVMNGDALVLGGTSRDILTRVRLGNQTFSGVCKLTNERNCDLSLKGISSRDFANKLRSHYGEVAFEFTQTPSSILGESSKTITNWNAKKQPTQNSAEVRK